MLPDHQYVRNNPGLNALVCDWSKYKRPFYSDNLWFFRALALSRGADMFHLETHVEVLYTMYKQSTPGNRPMDEFTGFKLSDRWVDNFVLNMFLFLSQLAVIL